MIFINDSDVIVWKEHYKTLYDAEEKVYDLVEHELIPVLNRQIVFTVTDESLKNPEDLSKSDYGIDYTQIKENKEILSQHRLYGTGTTASRINDATKLPVWGYKSGPLGGDQQIGAMLANGELGLIIFLRDPLTAQPHEPDVSALLRLCDVQKIPLATNASSAIIMLESLKNGAFATKE